LASGLLIFPYKYSVSVVPLFGLKNGTPSMATAIGPPLSDTVSYLIFVVIGHLTKPKDQF
jgi:hypothetical protein